MPYGRSTGPSIAHRTAIPGDNGDESGRLPRRHGLQAPRRCRPTRSPGDSCTHRSAAFMTTTDRPPTTPASPPTCCRRPGPAVPSTSPRTAWGWRTGSLVLGCRQRLVPPRSEGDRPACRTVPQQRAGQRPAEDSDRMSITVPIAGDERRRMYLLTTLTFVTGMVDGVGFVGLDHVFGGTATGNILILGMALGGGADLPIVGPLAALVTFSLGAMVAGMLLRGHPGRDWVGTITGILVVNAVVLAGLAGLLAITQERFA